MFWFKLRHRLRSYFQPRKLKFASDEAEMKYLMEQGVKDLRCMESNLSLEQRMRWAELTNRPFPEYRLIIM